MSCLFANPFENKNSKVTFFSFFTLYAPTLYHFDIKLINLFDRQGRKWKQFPMIIFHITFKHEATFKESAPSGIAFP